jgi:hypothetical protein
MGRAPPDFRHWSKALPLVGEWANPDKARRSQNPFIRAAQGVTQSSGGDLGPATRGAGRPHVFRYDGYGLQALVQDASSTETIR